MIKTPLWLRLAPLLTIAILTGPVLAGLAGVVAPAFGYAPLFGQNEWGTTALTGLFGEPGILTSIWLGFWIGPVTAFVALIVVALCLAAAHGTRPFGLITALIRPALAVPHAAAAFGFAFLFMPSGQVLRLLSPAVTGFTQPPDWLIINDPAGLSLLASLVVKEIPFLFLVALAALPQVDRRQADVAQTLGYGRVWAWLIAVFPGVYAQIRLPIFAVIVFASSVVDVALILGPGTPAPLSVRILHWTNDPDFDRKLVAGAAALVQLGLSGAGVLVWILGERLIARSAAALIFSGRRLPIAHWAGLLGVAFAGFAALIVLGGIAVLAISSFAGSWRFPDALPSVWSTKSWMQQSAPLLEYAATSTLLGITASLSALVLVLGCLEFEYRRGRRLSPRGSFLLYLPLLVPQISFLPGLAILFLVLRIDGNIWAVCSAHLVFVLPYTYLVLSDPWNAFDTRLLDMARALGKSPNRALLTVRLPMLLRPVLTALALGFAISIAQYLPTLLIGGGRVPTIATEAVALGSGGNRRLIGIYGLAQTALPFVLFVIAALVPAMIWRNRRAMRSGGAT